jgi:hypothetical protein
MSSNARRCAALVLTLLATGVPAAHASIPPGGDPGGDPGDGNKHHVHRLRPWRPALQYQMTRDAVAHVELNARADLQALVQKGQWWPIDCQLNNRTQNGVVLWNHVANVG